MPESAQGTFRFPLELVNHVLKFCNDKATLSSARLVCKSWAPFAESFLFDRLSINPNSPCTQILDSPIIRCIRHLVFEDEADWNSVDFRIDIAEYFHRFVIGSGSRITEIQSVELIFHHYSFTLSRTSGIFSSIPSQFSNIVKLNLDFYNENLRNIIRFICSFRKLQILGVSLASAWTQSTTDSSDLFGVGECTLPESLRILHFSHPSHTTAKSCFHDWLSLHPQRSKISTLSILRTHFFDLRPFTTLCPNTLRTLFLSFYNGFFPTGDFDLSYFKALENLTIDSPPIEDFPKILHLLGTLTSGHFHRFHLIANRTPSGTAPLEGGTYDDPEDHQRRNLAWESLDGVLLSERFTVARVGIEVQIVTLFFSGRTFQELETRIQGLLGGCYLQRRLSVTTFEDKDGISWNGLRKW
ncbi:hypothetical protein L218DRAFT_962044 [Marasmius fiardii PR-910]|nr:hypothetical protein L218DRAFT_962044 [Marasmius fiardii PR-910]